MSWSKFTLDNMNCIKSTLYNLSNDSKLLISIKSERDKIKQFMKENTINVIVKKLELNDSKKLEKKLIEYANPGWVDKKSLIENFPTLDESYLITWSSINNSDKTNRINIKCNNKYSKSILERINIIIYFLEYIRMKSDEQDLEIDIYLVLSDLVKIFPENNKTIGIKNANTGYTDHQKKIIFIWRYEEYIKVLFHEAIHFFALDKHDHHVDNIADIDGPHIYNEAITDVLGIYYHLIFLSLITKVKIKTLLELELSFIRNQAMTLNDHFGLGNWKGKPKKVIKQSTAAFSYYILKYLIFEWLLDNNLDESINYNDLLKKSLIKGFIMKPYVKIKSSRMSLLQLE
jgi:hypothetical protein